MRPLKFQLVSVYCKASGALVRQTLLSNMRRNQMQPHRIGKRHCYAVWGQSANEEVRIDQPKTFEEATILARRLRKEAEKEIIDYA